MSECAFSEDKKSLQCCLGVHQVGLPFQKMAVTPKDKEQTTQVAARQMTPAWTVSEAGSRLTW